MKRKFKLTKEEKDILNSYDTDEWVSSKSFSMDKRKFQEYAKATIEKIQLTKNRSNENID